MQGSLVLSASYSTLLTGSVRMAEIKAALVTAVAEIAVVDTSSVVVTLTLSRRLQSDTAEISIAYTITASANEAVVVVERITSTDLDSVTVVVAQHLSNAGIDGTFKAVGLSADIAGRDAGDNVKGLHTVWIGIGVVGVIGVLLAALCCCCCFYRCCCHGSGKAGGETKTPELALPTLISMERGMHDKHAAV